MPNKSYRQGVLSSQEGEIFMGMSGNNKFHGGGGNYCGIWIMGRFEYEKSSGEQLEQMWDASGK